MKESLKSYLDLKENCLDLHRRNPELQNQVGKQGGEIHLSPLNLHDLASENHEEEGASPSPSLWEWF